MIEKLSREETIKILKVTGNFEVDDDGVEDKLSVKFIDSEDDLTLSLPVSMPDLLNWVCDISTVPDMPDNRSTIDVEKAYSLLTNFINWYISNSSKKQIATIAKLLSWQDKVAGYLWFIQEECAKYSAYHNRDYAERKFRTAIKEVKFMENLSNPLSGVHSKSKAESEIGDIRKTEVINYNIANRLQGLIKRADMLLKVCSQRIAWLREEEKNARFQQQGEKNKK